MSTPRTGPSALETVRARLRRLGAAARAAEDLADDARQARDTAIGEADLAGMSVREIATDVGVSRPRVHKIVIRLTALRQAAARLRAGG